VIIVFYVCRAKIALDESCKAMINSLVKLPTLCISGIDHFQNSVVFAKVQADEAFDQLAVIAGMQLNFVTKVFGIVLSSD